MLVVSFVALAALWSTPRLERIPERRLLRLPLVVDVVLGALGVLVFAASVYAGLAGTDFERDNLAPTVIFVFFWVGVPFASLLFGDVWRLLSPWRAIGRAAGGDREALRRRRLPEPLAYPTRVGQWPAAAVIFGFAVCELCWATGREPATLAIIMLLYLVVSLVGMSIYGVEAWTRNADGFGVLFGLFASLAPFTRREGVLYARPPVVGATGSRRCRGDRRAAGLDRLDGVRRRPRRGRCSTTIVPHLQDFFEGLGLSQRARARAGVRARAGGLDRVRVGDLLGRDRGDAARAAAASPAASSAARSRTR